MAPAFPGLEAIARKALATDSEQRFDRPTDCAALDVYLADQAANAAAGGGAGAPAAAAGAAGVCRGSGGGRSQSAAGSRRRPAAGGRYAATLAGTAEPEPPGRALPYAADAYVGRRAVPPAARWR